MSYDVAVRRLLEAVAGGRIDPGEAAARLRDLPFADLGEVRVDHHRGLRTGTPEVVLGEGKTPAQCAEAAAELLTGGDGPVVVTRADPQQAAAVRTRIPEATYHDDARVVFARPASPQQPVDGRVAVVTAGTGDLPVARECTVVLDAFGVTTKLLADVGVAGVHRLLAVRGELETADVVVAVAGMEGALPTLVAGLVPPPVIAVPTSTGYGAAFGGIAALLGMLTSCAPGVSVVNIDAGFSAALVAVRILRGRADSTAGTPARQEQTAAGRIEEPACPPDADPAPGVSDDPPSGS